MPCLDLYTALYWARDQHSFKSTSSARAVPPFHVECFTRHAVLAQWLPKGDASVCAMQRPSAGSGLLQPVQAASSRPGSQAGPTARQLQRPFGELDVRPCSPAACARNSATSAACRRRRPCRGVAPSLQALKIRVRQVRNGLCCLVPQLLVGHGLKTLYAGL